jgi:hypothetical protein
LKNYFRELLYNLEHCIHHQALIKWLFYKMKLFLWMNFGVARSTIEYRKLCTVSFVKPIVKLSLRQIGTNSWLDPVQYLQKLYGKWQERYLSQRSQSRRNLVRSWWKGYGARLLNGANEKHVWAWTIGKPLIVLDIIGNVSRIIGIQLIWIV